MAPDDKTASEWRAGLAGLIKHRSQNNPRIVPHTENLERLFCQIIELKEEPKGGAKVSSVAKLM